MWGLFTDPRQPVFLAISSCTLVLHPGCLLDFWPENEDDDDYIGSLLEPPELEDDDDDVTEEDEPELDTGGPGVLPSIAIAPDGAVHVTHHSVYYGSAGTGDPVGHFFHLTNEGGTWSTSLLAADTQWGGFSEMGFDAVGALHVAFHDGASPAHATRVSGSWELVRLADLGIASEEPIGTAVGDVSMGIDSGGVIYLAYPCGGEACVATRAQGVWSSEQVTFLDGMVRAVELRIDSSDRVHIALIDGSARQGLEATRSQDGTWNTEFIADLDYTNGHLSFVLDDDDVGHVLFAQPFGGPMFVGDDADGPWSIVEIPAWSVGYPPITTTRQGLPRVAHSTSAEFRLARPHEGEWTVAVVDPQQTAGINCGIALDAFDTVHLAYSVGDAQSVRDSLRYATGAGDDWDITVLAE